MQMRRMAGLNHIHRTRVHIDGSRPNRDGPTRRLHHALHHAIAHALAAQADHIVRREVERRPGCANLAEDHLLAHLVPRHVYDIMNRQRPRGPAGADLGDLVLMSPLLFIHRIADGATRECPDAGANRRSSSGLAHGAADERAVAAPMPPPASAPRPVCVAQPLADTLTIITNRLTRMSLCMASFSFAGPARGRIPLHRHHQGRLEERELCPIPVDLSSGVPGSWRDWGGKRRFNPSRE